MPDARPNILFIMSDDHASHAISCYGSRINRTPHLDRIAEGGMRFNNCFCTNSICTPSRAVILTGTYNHINGVTTLASTLDGRQVTMPKLLQSAGYQTAIVGKWHLGHGGVNDPTGFDYWNVLPGQGLYHDPEMIEMGERKVFPGYVTDLITDFSLDWLRARDPERPFMLMCHHKAPHRSWEPDEKHALMYEDEEIPYPETFNDDYSNRAAAAAAAEMRIDRDMTLTDLKQPTPEGLTPEEEKKWKYQRYIKDYLRCVASIDDNVGRLLDYLEEEGLAENTRSSSIPRTRGSSLATMAGTISASCTRSRCACRCLSAIRVRSKGDTVNDQMVLNVDFTPTLLEYAGVDIPEHFQGTSFCEPLDGPNAGWLADIDVLPLLDAPGTSPRLCPLWGAHVAVQADLLLRRRIGSTWSH